MTIKEYRYLLKLTQQEFSQTFGIPLGTLRNWEQDLSTPPAYVTAMLTAIIRRDKMINVETVKLVKLVEDLAKRSLNGIKPFDDATEETKDLNIFYDTNKFDDDGYFVVYWSCVDSWHHDIRSYYDSVSNGYKVRAIISEVASPSIRITLHGSNEAILISDGNWEFEEDVN